MAKFVFVGTHAPEDSNRASFPFLQDATAVAEGHQASIVLYGESSLLMKDAIAENLHGLGLPSFKENTYDARANDICSKRQTSNLPGTAETSSGAGPLRTDATTA